jgi:hypothetical protein
VPTGRRGRQGKRFRLARPAYGVSLRVPGRGSPPPGKDGDCTDAGSPNTGMLAGKASGPRGAASLNSRGTMAASFRRPHLTAGRGLKQPVPFCGRESRAVPPGSGGPGTETRRSLGPVPFKWSLGPVPFQRYRTLRIFIAGTAGELPTGGA